MHVSMCVSIYIYMYSYVCARLRSTNNTNQNASKPANAKPSTPGCFSVVAVVWYCVSFLRLSDSLWLSLSHVVFCLCLP